MVVSTAPAFLGATPAEGAVGVVQAGDCILISNREDGTGVAVSPAGMTVLDYARVVGRAWEGSAEAGIKQVIVVVGRDLPEPAAAAVYQEVQALQADRDALRLKVETLEARLQRIQAVLGRASGYSTGR
ncbi:MAG: hypothetical protein ACI9WU_000155 [Myxococcota bacterium]|jgi:hypothetical protein